MKYDGDPCLTLMGKTENGCLTYRMLVKKFNSQHFEIFFSFFFLQKIGFDIYENCLF